MVKRNTKRAGAADLLEDRYVRENECAAITGLSRTTRWRLERSGKFPRRREISDNAMGWLLSEIRQWRDSKSPPSAPPAGEDRAAP